MTTKDDFFIKENEIRFIPNEDYASLKLYEEFLDAFARTTYKSIYVIDYFRKNFFYVSENPLFLCGIPAEKVKEMGYEFYFSQVPKEELPLLLEINKTGFLFTENISSDHIMEYTLSYDFHIKQPSEKDLLINHKITPLRLTKEGKVWLALCTASISSQTTSGNIEFTREGHNERWSYSFESKKWKQREGIELKESERNVLKLSMQGYTMNEIAERMFKSVDTIKTYKRHLFEKLDVENITEAISFAINKKLI